MKNSLILCLLVVGLAVLVQEASAHWGWRGYGYRRYGGYGWGYRPRFYYRPYYRPFGYYYRPVYYYPYRRFYYRGIDINPIEKERIICNYISDRSILSCSGKSALIECRTSVNMTSEPDFEFFGIRKQIIDKSTEASSVRFELYPRTTDNKLWLNNKIYYDNKYITYSLYNSDRDTDYGFRVLDSRCYKELVDLIDRSAFEQHITLENNELYRFKSENATIIGDIQMEDD